MNFVYRHKRAILCGLVCATLLAHQFPAQSQALPAPAANFVVNRAIGGVITRVAVARGFAANDPRIAATLTGASQSLTAVNAVSTVAGVTLAVAGAPVWLTIAASLGVLAVGAAIVAGKSTIKLQNGGIVFSEGVQSNPTPYTPVAITNSQNFYQRFATQGLKIYKDAYCKPSQFCNLFPLLPSEPILFKWTLPVIDPVSHGYAYAIFNSLEDLTANFPAFDLIKPNVGRAVESDVGPIIRSWSWLVPPYFEFSANGSPRLLGQGLIKIQCIDIRDDCLEWQSGKTPSPWNSQTAEIQIGSIDIAVPYKNLDDAKKAVSPSIRQQPLSDSALAKMADQAWKLAASAPGYKGLPYSVTSPITETDVAGWRVENPKAVPVVADLLLPANSAATTEVVISPVANTATQPENPTNPDPNAIYNVAVVNAPRVDLGGDPQVASPTLTDAPTAESAISPLTQLFPELKKFQVPQHASECPKPEFDAFDKHFVIDTHCNLAQQHSATIGSITLLMWVIIGILILLSA